MIGDFKINFEPYEEETQPIEKIIPLVKVDPFRNLVYKISEEDKHNLIYQNHQGTTLWEIPMELSGKTSYWLPPYSERIYITNSVLEHLAVIDLRNGNYTKRQLNRLNMEDRDSWWQGFVELKDGGCFFLYEKGIMRFDKEENIVWQNHGIPSKSHFVKYEDEYFIYRNDQNEFWGYHDEDGHEIPFHAEKKNPWNPIIGGLFYLISFFISLAACNIFVKILMDFQEQIFGHDDSVLFISSSDFWPTFLAVLSFFFFCQLFISINRYMRRKYGFQLNRRGIFFIRLYMVLFFPAVLMGLFSYCNVTTNGIYYRDIHTAFVEKFYAWEQVRDIRISSNWDRDKEASELKLYMEFGPHRVDLLNAVWRDLDKKNGQIRRVYQLAKVHRIPQTKSIVYIDEEDKEVLAYIEGHKAKK